MQAFFASIILKLGDLLIDKLGKMFSEFIKNYKGDRKIEKEVKKCSEISDPVKRAACISGEL